MEIHSVGAELFHVHGQTERKTDREIDRQTDRQRDRRDKAYSCFPQFRKYA